MFTRWHHSQIWLDQARPDGFDDTGLRSAYRRLNDWTWEHFSFLDLIDLFRGLHATDPRDKIYALLGLLRHSLGEQIQIKVDYHKSVPEVLFDAISQSVRSEGNLHFLSYIHYHPNLEDRGPVASWLPRWDETREPWHDHLWNNRSVISASREHKLRDFPVTYAEKIPLQGVHFDTVSDATEVLSSTSTAKSLPLLSFLREQIRRLVALFITSYGISSSSPDIDFANLNLTEEDLSLFARALVKVATTLTGGYIKSDGWVENRAYIERIGTDVGLQYLADFFAFLEEQDMIHHFSRELRKTLRIELLTGHAFTYMELVRIYCGGRRLFETQGYIGLGPGDIKKGDVVAVLDGGKVPYMLRPFENKGEYAFLGECFVYEIMNGEVYEMCGQREVEEKVFVLR